MEPNKYAKLLQAVQSVLAKCHCEESTCEVCAPLKEALAE